MRLIKYMFLFSIVLGCQKVEKREVYYSFGDKLIEERYYVLKSDTTIRHGSYKQFFTDGMVYIKGKYSNGKKDGLWQVFLSDGTMQMQTKFKDDIINGQHNIYFPNGKIKRAEVYKMDTLWSVSDCYDEEGNKLNCGNINEGIGTVNYYRHDGTISKSINVNRDKFAN